MLAGMKVSIGQRKLSCHQTGAFRFETLHFDEIHIPRYMILVDHGRDQHFILALVNVTLSIIWRPRVVMTSTLFLAFVNQGKFRF